MTQPQDKMRAEFEAHWKTIRGLIKSKRELKRRETEPQAYACDSANRHWITWQAACAQQSAQSQQDALDAARSNGVSWDSGFLTVVYRGVAPGPEAQELCTHPKASAMSWSHAINDRDAAIAAKGASNV